MPTRRAIEGRDVYDLYCTAMSTLPDSVTRGQALPAYDFLNEELLDAWQAFAEMIEDELR